MFISDLVRPRIDQSRPDKIDWPAAFLFYYFFKKVSNSSSFHMLDKLRAKSSKAKMRDSQSTLGYRCTKV